MPGLVEICLVVLEKKMKMQNVYDNANDDDDDNDNDEDGLILIRKGSSELKSGVNYYYIK